MAAERGGAAFEQLLRQLHEQHRKEVAELHQAIWELRQIAVKGGDPRPGPQTPRGDDDDLASFRDSHADRATLDGLPTDKPANDSGRESIGQDNTGHLVCIDGLTTETELPIQTQDENAALPSEEKRAAPEHAHSFRGPGVGAEASKRIMMADTIIGCVIMLNIVFIFVRLDYDGYITSVELGLDDPGKWPDLDFSFDVMQHVFCAIFLIELIGRLIWFKRSYFYSDRFEKFNTFDAVIVVFTCLDLYIITPFFSSGSGSDFTVIRALRFVRVLRAMRHEVFSKLRLLLSTVAASFFSLSWSLVLLFITMLLAALILTQIINPFLSDSSIDSDTIYWLFKHYGTAGRSLWTVFEMTFSGGWPNYGRRLVEEVGVGFAFFFAVYITTVVFAMTRIITALFLKDTLAVAASDAELQMKEKEKEKKAYAARLLEFFNGADTSGDGKITFSEFQEFVTDPRVRTYLMTLELDASETENLFTMLDDGDGSVTAEEFVHGAMRLKGVARSQDVVSIMHDSTRLHKKVDKLQLSIEGLITRL
eukprot:CAMPEP_0115298472 /NCGR_PEP_ID=MMETSP0270-20121206/68279_1 /TAXON_ID=71861 /ORGANISM="Scrippsiella trochoidea, Strain CCMP3099" /LENGTH=534 /DNA_ID=CAMNT_0002716157 /DNA_START=42 /DNA_END=1646 /DNA_ORIENTATION=+